MKASSTAIRPRPVTMPAQKRQFFAILPSFRAPNGAQHGDFLDVWSRWNPALEGQEDLGQARAVEVRQPTQLGDGRLAPSRFPLADRVIAEAQNLAHARLRELRAQSQLGKLLAEDLQLGSI